MSQRFKDALEYSHNLFDHPSGPYTEKHIIETTIKKYRLVGWEAAALIKDIKETFKNYYLDHPHRLEEEWVEEY